MDRRELGMGGYLYHGHRTHEGKAVLLHRGPSCQTSKNAIFIFLAPLISVEINHRTASLSCFST